MTNTSPTAIDAKSFHALPVHLIKPLLSVFLFVAGAVGIYHLLQEISYHALVAEIGTLSVTRLCAAILFTASSFMALTGYDRLALAYLKLRVPLRTIALGAFCGYAISNTIGYSILSSGSVRLRMYVEDGVDAADVARLSVIALITLILGTLAVGAAALLLEPERVAPLMNLTAGRGQQLGILLDGVIASLIIVCFIRSEPINLGIVKLRLPTGTIALLQLGVAVIDVLSAGACLYVLIDFAPLSPVVVLAVYAAALLAGLLSQLPGGIGVFEGVILLGLRDVVPPTTLTAALIGYRVVYYFLPLMLATGILLLKGAKANCGLAAETAQRIRHLGAKLIPLAMATMTFFNGLILLISTATPSIPERLRVLEAFVPIVWVELSTLTASVIGVALLLLAHGLYRKLNGAYVLTLILCMVGSVASLIKGIDFEEGAVLAVSAIALYFSRHEFYRRTALLDAPFTWPWIIAIIGAVVGMVGIVLFSYKHVDYSHHLWWHFAYSAEASRSLRALLSAMVALVVVTIYRLLQSPVVKLNPPDTAEISEAERIVRGQDLVSASLVMMADKHLVFSASRDAFVMFGIKDRSWIVYGDPIGNPESFDELAWQLRESADRARARLAFYQAKPDLLPLYLDLDLTPLKLGEEAVVPLPQFTLEGSRSKSIRQSHARAVRGGLRFELLSRTAISEEMMQTLSRISEAWLAEKKTREKGFSLGSFSPNYMRHFDIAIIRHSDEVVAFANVMCTGTKAEVTVDLMRYVSAAPPTVMDFLFVELLLYFQSAGYQRFMLGMAPLSGLDRHELAPLWYRLGHQIFTYGEQFYNFRGLRAFKEKFNPIWEPRYLLTEGGINALLVLNDVAALISRGRAGIFRK